MQGKFIEIHFSATGKICGANIQTCKLTQAIHFTRHVLDFISMPIVFTELTYFCGCDCHIPTHMLTRTDLLEKVISDAPVWTNYRTVIFIFCHLWNIMCAVCSQELFNWSVVRGRITYFINFVLDLHLVLKVCFLRNLLTFVYLSTFQSHNHFLYDIFVSIYGAYAYFSVTPSYLVYDMFVSIYEVYAIGWNGNDHWVYFKEPIIPFFYLFWKYWSVLMIKNFSARGIWIFIGVLLTLVLLLLKMTCFDNEYDLPLNIVVNSILRKMWPKKVLISERHPLLSKLVNWSELGPIQNYIMISEYIQDLLDHLLLSQSGHALDV